MNKQLQRLALLSPLALAINPAHAAIDVTAITAAITEASTAGATVGLAVVVMIVGLKVFKWVRRAM